MGFRSVGYQVVAQALLNYGRPTRPAPQGITVTTPLSHESADTIELARLADDGCPHVFENDSPTLHRRASSVAVLQDARSAARREGAWRGGRRWDDLSPVRSWHC